MARDEDSLGPGYWGREEVEDSIAPGVLLQARIYVQS